jgi:hypothetical protein
LPQITFATLPPCPTQAAAASVGLEVCIRSAAATAAAAADTDTTTGTIAGAKTWPPANPLRWEDRGQAIRITVARPAPTPEYAPEVAGEPLQFSLTDEEDEGEWR